LIQQVHRALASYDEEEWVFRNQLFHY
jgi:hypothetical protein